MSSSAVVTPASSAGSSAQSSPPMHPYGSSAAAAASMRMDTLTIPSPHLHAHGQRDGGGSSSSKAAGSPLPTPGSCSNGNHASSNVPPHTPAPITPSAEDLARQARRISRLVGRMLSVDIHAPLDPQAALLKSIQCVRSDLQVRWGHLGASTFFAAPLSEVRLEHIVQGELGDGAFLSTLATLVRAKKLQSLLLPPPSYDPDDPEDEAPDPDVRTFLFHAWDPDTSSSRAQRTPVMATVPVEKSSNLPVAAGLPEENGWAALLEKAYATLMGGYDKIHSGAWATQTLYTLSGVTARTMELREQKDCTATTSNGTGGKKQRIAQFEDIEELLSRSTGVLMLVSSKRAPGEAPLPNASVVAAAVSSATSSSSAASSSTSSSSAFRLPTPQVSPATPSPQQSPRPFEDVGQTYALLGARLVRDETQEGKDVPLVELWAPWPSQQQLLQTLHEGEEEGDGGEGASADEHGGAQHLSEPIDPLQLEDTVPATVSVPLRPRGLQKSWAHWTELESRWNSYTLKLEQAAAARNGAEIVHRAPGTIVLPWEAFVAHPEFQQLHYSDL